MSTAPPGAAARLAPPDVLTSAAARWRVERAWPRPDRTVLVEVVDEEHGQLTGGRWVPHGVDVPASPAGLTVPADGGTAVLHPGGDDPRLPRLADDLVAGGRLLGHRVGRRAVVARPDGSYAKHVRARSVPAVVGGLEAAAAALAGLAAPTRLRTVEVARVRTVEAGSVVVLEPLAGMSLLELGRRADDAVVLAAWRATAELLAALQAGDPGSATWSSQQEESATRRLVEPAVAAGLLDAGAVELVEQVAGRLHRLGAPDRVVPLHRDLHDQQVLVDAEAGRAPRLGLLDCDTAVAGDPALDPGNLLAHLRLRVLQGLLRPDRAATAAAALGAVTGGSGEESLRLHQRLTLLRLAGLYVWRPRWRHLGPALLAAAREEAPTPA